MDFAIDCYVDVACSCVPQTYCWGCWEEGASVTRDDYEAAMN